VTANYLNLQQQILANNAAAAAAAAGPGIAGILAGGLGPGGPVNLTGRPVLNPNDSALSTPGGNATSAITLGLLRQSELARLLQRYQVSALYEMAAAARGLEYAVQAQQIYNTLKQDCEDQLAAARLAAAGAAGPGAAAGTATTAPGTTPATGTPPTGAAGTGPATGAAAATGAGSTTGTTAAGPSGTTVTTGTMPSPTSTGTTAPQP
jgi:hypothetical protein